MKKIILESKFGPKGSKLVLKLGSLPFSQVGLLDFLEILYNYSLQQCTTSSRDKTHKKVLSARFGSKQAKIGPKTRFSVICSSLVH